MLGVSKFKKTAIWSKIADDVSTLGPIRSVKQCKKRVSDQKSASKSKAAKRSASKGKTGGGPVSPDKLDELDELIISKLPRVSFEVLFNIKFIHT